jgi:hypothetical protein
MPTSVPPLPSSPPAKTGRWLLFGCGGVLAVLLLIVAAVAITLWWMQRPIKPVVLSAQEKVTVDEKLRYVEEPKVSRPPDRTATSGNPPAPAIAGTQPNPAEDRPYVPGSKVLKLTEREINGLLNQNTDLGNSVRLEFDQDAVNAYVAVPIPKDFPVAGGKMFRARGRFRVSLGNGGTPYAILEDVTVFGLSLPKAWLGGIKGENLLGDAVGQQNGAPAWKGIKSLRVEPGALVIEVED